MKMKLLVLSLCTACLPLAYGSWEPGEVHLPKREPVSAAGEVMSAEQVWEELRSLIPALRRSDVDFRDNQYAAIPRRDGLDYATWFSRYFLTRFRPDIKGSYFRPESSDCEQFAHAWISLLAFTLDEAFPPAGALAGIIVYYPEDGSPRHAGVVWRDEKEYVYLEPQARLHPKWRPLTELDFSGRLELAF